MYTYDNTGTLAIAGIVWSKVIGLTRGIASNLSTDGTTGVFTINDDGVYEITCTGSFVYSVNGADIQIAVFVGASEQENLSTTIWAATAKGKSTFTLTGLIELSTSEEVSIQIASGSPGNVTMGTGSIKINKIANQTA
jgi:hypothetical protein